MKKKILIVEDEEMLLTVLTEQFSKAGFDVQAASDGEKALQSLEKSKPDLVLLDIILPKINGFDVLKAIKENPNTIDIPVIMISNLGRDEDIKQAIKLGAADYYIKAQHPLFEIIEKVDKFLSQPKSPLEKPKVPAKEKKVVAPAAPAEVVKEEKPAEVEPSFAEATTGETKVSEKPMEKIVEKPVEIVAEKPAEKVVEIIPEKIIEEKPIKTIVEKLVEKVVEKPIIEEKPAVAIAEKPKKEAVKKPAKGEMLGKLIDIVEDSAKKAAKKRAEKAAEKPKVVEAPKVAPKPAPKTEEKPVEAKKPVEKKAKKEEKYPHLPKSARKFIRMKKAELSKMELEPEKYEEEVAKLYQTFTPKKKTESAR